MREFLINFHHRDSFFHHLDPITKLVWVLCVSCISLMISDLLSQFILVIIIVFFVRVGARIPFKDLALFIWIFLGLSLSFFFIQILTTNGKWVLFFMFGFPITWEAVNHAGNVATRMLVFLGMALTFVDSTDPHDLGTALAQKLKINYAYALMIFMTLRFIPLFEKELYDLRHAYKLRNIGNNTGFLERIRMLKLFLSSLLYRGVRRSIILAFSIESRAFRAYTTRSYVTIVEIPLRGKVFSGVMIGLTFSYVLLKFFGFY